MLKRFVFQDAWGRWGLFLTAFLLGLLMQSAIFAQTRHHLQSGSMPPGLASQTAILSNPNLQGHNQVCKVIAPMNTTIHSWNQGYALIGSGEAKVGLSIGSVYRFKLSDIPRNPGLELYPSVELLSRLHPPKGKELEFPVPLVITMDDLNEVIAGNMVTKVIYLEDPETALPFQQEGDNIRNIDIGGYEDTLHTADRLGRPMAIIRIGSRQPLANDAAGEFEFFGPPVTHFAQQERLPQGEAIPVANPANSQTNIPREVGATKRTSYQFGDN